LLVIQLTINYLKATLLNLYDITKIKDGKKRIYIGFLSQLFLFNRSSYLPEKIVYFIENRFFNRILLFENWHIVLLTFPLFYRKSLFYRTLSSKNWHIVYFFLTFSKKSFFIVFYSSKIGISLFLPSFILSKIVFLSYFTLRKLAYRLFNCSSYLFKKIVFVISRDKTIFTFLTLFFIQKIDFLLFFFNFFFLKMLKRRYPTRSSGIPINEPEGSKFSTKRRYSGGVAINRKVLESAVKFSIYFIIF
jgi:hypothetical protein